MEILCSSPEVAICAALNADWLLLFGCWVHHLFWRKGKAKFPHIQLYTSNHFPTRSCNAFSCYHIHLQELMCPAPHGETPQHWRVLNLIVASGCYLQASPKSGGVCVWGYGRKRSSYLRERPISFSSWRPIYQHPVTQPGEEGSRQFTQLQLFTTLGYKNPSALWCYRGKEEKLQIKALVFNSIW